jgi:carbamoylphosphate synthase large subunit
MAIPIDYHVETNRIQEAIENHLSVEGKVMFDFVVSDGKTKLNLITINRRHNQSFLFHSELGVDKLDALQKMLDYVRNYREVENSFTIQWRAEQDKELHTSYFRARNMYEALDKFYFGRDQANVIVYTVSLNPLT